MLNSHQLSDRATCAEKKRTLEKPEPTSLYKSKLFFKDNNLLGD